MYESIANFFQLSSLPADQLFGVYDFRLVLLSYIVATFASYIALDITGRLRDVGNTKFSSTMWLLGGAFAMGAGIWSMHFIGMLAFSLPSMSMSYELFWTSLSLLVAFLASCLALYLLKSNVARWGRLALGGVIIGFGIASMHYVGMEAMKIHVDIHYLVSLFLASIGIAIIASEAALWLALKSNQVIARMRFRLKSISALIMGAAICGMHYTGMAAAVFTPKLHPVMDHSALDPGILAVSIAGITFIIMGLAFFLSTYKEALNQQLLATARQAGMAEVAASVLHNVGNVLNSVNVSASLVSEKISQSKLQELNELSRLMNDHKDNLSQFITQDPRGSHLPEYISKLSEHWKKEQNAIMNETQVLLKNVEHIKDIIALQQNLSKSTTGIEQIVSVDNLLDEALFITGIETNHPEIKIEKNYDNIKPILLDKVKLLQILVNLIRNAKDAVVANGASYNKKVIVLKTTLDKNKFSIEVIDNGIGISPSHLTRIFGYGFTTKQSGHGFGLHSSALAAKEMGGVLQATSNGNGKGATFILDLPLNYPK